jgi:hypothetical protein
METYLKSLGVDVCFSVASGYNALKKPKIAAQKEARGNNKMAIDTILDGLTDSVKSNVGSYASSKEIWGKLHDQNLDQGSKFSPKIKVSGITSKRTSA